MCGKEIEKIKFFACKQYIFIIKDDLPSFGADDEVSDSNSFFRHGFIELFRFNPHVDRKLRT